MFNEAIRPVSVVVDRQYWHRGDKNPRYHSGILHESSALNVRVYTYRGSIFNAKIFQPDNHCCVGFLAKTCGFAVSPNMAYLHNCQPSDGAWMSLDEKVRNIWREGKQTETNERGESVPTVLGSLYLANDDHSLDGATRELVIQHLGEMLGVDFTFIN